MRSCERDGMLGSVGTTFNGKWKARAHVIATLVAMTDDDSIDTSCSFLVRRGLS
jgi:hypothetical protein